MGGPNTLAKWASKALREFAGTSAPDAAPVGHAAAHFEETILTASNTFIKKHANPGKNAHDMFDPLISGAKLTRLMIDEGAQQLGKTVVKPSLWRAPNGSYYGQIVLERTFDSTDLGKIARASTNPLHMSRNANGTTGTARIVLRTVDGSAAKVAPGATTLRVVSRHPVGATVARRGLGEITTTLGKAGALPVLMSGAVLTGVDELTRQLVAARGIRLERQDALDDVSNDANAWSSVADFLIDMLRPIALDVLESGPLDAEDIAEAEQTHINHAVSKFISDVNDQALSIGVSLAPETLSDLRDIANDMASDVDQALPADGTLHTVQNQNPTDSSGTETNPEDESADPEQGSSSSNQQDSTPDLDHQSADSHGPDGGSPNPGGQPLSPSGDGQWNVATPTPVTGHVSGDIEKFVERYPEDAQYIDDFIENCRIGGGTTIEVNIDYDADADNGEIALHCRTSTFSEGGETSEATERPDEATSESQSAEVDEDKPSEIDEPNNPGEDHPAEEYEEAAISD